MLTRYEVLIVVDNKPFNLIEARGYTLSAAENEAFKYCRDIDLNGTIELCFMGNPRHLVLFESEINQWRELTSVVETDRKAIDLTTLL